MRNIHFYLPRKESKVNTIRFKFTVNYQTISGSTNQKIETKSWDFKKARTKPSYKYSSLINKKLNDIKEKIDTILMELQINNNLTKNDFLDAYYLKNDKPDLTMNVFDFYEKYLIPHKRNMGISANTIRSYKNSAHKLKNYCEFQNLKQERLTLRRIMEHTFYSNYLGYLGIECGHMLNYQGSLVKQLKTIINHAREIGIHNEKLPKSYKKPTETVEPIVLTKGELKKLELCQCLTRLESIARDWFIISCKTGLRISDFLVLQIANFDFDRNIISLRTQKNSNKLIDIPISEAVLNIIEKNGNNLPQKISEAKLNSNIKQACLKAGIDSNVIIERKIKGKIQSTQVPKHTKISAHCGRRTFATHAFEDGLLNLSELKLITGHSDIKTLMLYIRVDNKIVAEKMQKNMDKLNW